MNSPQSTAKTASSSLPVGMRLAEFEITGVIGEGGFGIVYSAHDLSLQRMVAIKEYLPTAFAQRADDGSVQVKSEEYRKTFTAGLTSFVNEARMLAKFSHPGLVEVFRFWEASGTAYMVMRYYRGVTLREALRSSRELITEQWLCETLDPILLALKELHNERCFHRDVAPDNILVLPNGKSVLMDFGAARRIISGMTQALTTVLKPGYAPIEQYYDDGSMPQGAWTDIYAVGGLLYYMMVGKVPVQAISRMMSDPLKPVSEVALGAYSERLCSVVMKCLAVLPEHRYQSIDELRGALGWVILPVMSTLPRQPEAAPTTASEFPETVLMTPASAERIALAQAGIAPRSSRMTAMVADTDHPKSGPDATVKSGASQPSDSKIQASGDRTGPPAAKSERAPLMAEDLPAKAVKKAPSVTSQHLPAPGSRLSARQWLGLAVFVLALAGAGVFVSGVYKSDVSVSEMTDAVPNVKKSAEVALPTPVAAATSSVPASVPATGTASGTATPIETSVPPALAATSAASSTASQVKMGNVRIEIVGGWGNVIVDGELKGTVPPVLLISLEPGSHDIEIQNPASAIEKRKVAVLPGKTVLVRHSFVK